MPWELSSVISRLRRPVRPQPAPGPPSQDTVSQPRTEVSDNQLPVDRRILQDPSSFLDAQVRDVLPLGLTPSTRLPSAGSGHNARSHSHHKRIDPSSEPPTGRSDLPSSSSVDISSRTPESRFTINRLSKITSGGGWSTFGRKRERRIPDAVCVSGHLDDPESSQSSPTKDKKHLSADSMLSTYSLSRVTNASQIGSSTHEKHSTHSTRSPRRSPDIRLDSKPSSPTDTVSSFKRHPRTPQRPHSYTAPGASHTTSSVTNFTTPVNREPAFDSPHTFGHPTPPDNSVDLTVAYPSSYPPLPPLDHPELATTLPSRRKSTSTAQSALSTRDRSNTLPTGRRIPRKDELFTSPFKFGRSFHRSSFSEAMAEQRENRSSKHRRARSVSVIGMERRTSAEWSSYEATAGVTSHANPAWPALVSRELLRLCGHETRGPGSSENRESTSRGGSPDPVRRLDRGVMSPSSFLPFPHPSHPSSSSPLLASATLTEEREIFPARSRSLRFNLANRRNSEQSPARITNTMAEVKRSLSVIEVRHSPRIIASGANDASFGLIDPGPTSKVRLVLDPSSALARSQSLLSGRVSANNTPMSSPLQEEPSTPTPAPRHQSDKSIGKRKAEDIDLTPPEQKKEGQRATFLLPTEARSQRISNSSHAPSSYHRKRARLSATSPFATPVQSRPSSVQETPHSASRSQRFTSLSSSTGARFAPSRTPSRAASARSRQPPTPSTTRRHERHQSISQASIPLSAIVSPHAPSISHSTKFHMRDPRKPPKKLSDTPWGLRLATEDDPGSPMQAWFFFFGFLLFPIWWIAGLFLRVPKTRIAGDIDTEKGVTIDDPQIEHDARAWRFRCRVMAVVSLFTYVPFIVLVTIFAPR